MSSTQKLFLARQPIIDKVGKTAGYELLYRDGTVNAYTGGIDGTEASLRLITGAATTFGLENITGSTRAYINFTRGLLLSDLIYSISPQNVVIELLETVNIDSVVTERIKKLHDDGYCIALDDYVGGSEYNQLLSMNIVDIIKVDFIRLTEFQRRAIALKLSRLPVQLLAEKVETAGEYENAVSYGYDLFQGYFFAKPAVHSVEATPVSRHSCVRLLKEFNREDPDIDALSRIVQSDVNLTYHLLQIVNTLQYFRGNKIKSAKNAIVMLGLKRVRNWVTLISMSELVGNRPDELARTALLRACFIEKLAALLPYADVDPDEGFLFGLFSLIDVLMGRSITEIIGGLPLSPELLGALRGEPGAMNTMLFAVKCFETADWAGIDDASRILDVQPSDLGDVYLEAAKYADTVYASL